MSKPRIFLAISASMLAALACNILLPTPQPTPMVVIIEPTFAVQDPDLPATEADVPRASLEQALTAYNAGAAVFVDVRAPQSYEISHIPGAINIPLGEFETNIANVNLNKEEWIITYCT